MFLRASTRKKDGRTHRYWSVVDNRRLADGRVLQRHEWYLGEINDSQARLAAFHRGIGRTRECAAHGRVVTRGSHRRVRVGHVGGTAAPVAAEAVSSAGVGFMLAGAEAMGAPGAGPILVAAPVAKPQGYALGAGAVCPGGLPAAVAGERVAIAVLGEMRDRDPPVYYLVGTPKGRLSRLEKDLLLKPWHEVRPGVQVKLLTQDDEMYVFAQSHDRIAKERAMRKRQLKRLWARLAKLSSMKLSAAQSQSPSAWRLVEVNVDDAFTYALRRNKLREVRRREGRYLLRTNLTSTDPAELWRYYIQLVQVEQAFKDLRGDLAVRPIYHQFEQRVEAHIFIAFLAYCLHVTLAQQLRPHARGLSPRSVLDKFAAVHIPTPDGRELVLTRYTEPERELKLLLERLNLELPAQPPPKITAPQANAATSM